MDGTEGNERHIYILDSLFEYHQPHQYIKLKRKIREIV